MTPTLVAPPASGFSGPFSEFYASHIEPNLPSPAAVRAMHELLVRYVADEGSTLFVVRKFDGRARGMRLAASDAAVSLVCGDNEPALWFYARAFLEDFADRIGTLADAVRRRTFPIGFARRADLGESQEFWPNWGREGWESSFGRRRLYHAHLFDAAKGIPAERLDRRNLRCRMVRLLHPANHFPMPTHLGDDCYTSGGARLDFSEVHGIKRFICERFADRYREVWAEFLCLADADPLAFAKAENLRFECTPSAKTPPASQVAPLPEASRSSTRFRIDEESYRELVAGEGPFVLAVAGGTGQHVHPSGTYVVPRDVMLRFIESKRGQRNWLLHRNFLCASVQVPLRRFFRPE